MTNYTLNIALDSGMQLGGTDYSSVNSATIGVSDSASIGTLFGNPGLLVDTPGAVTGEGVMTPASPVQDNVNHSFSVFIQGTKPGNLTVYAIANPGGTILGSAPVTLTTNGSWQRVTINNIAATTTQTLSLIISTTGAQATEFWIANVQIEESSSAHPYCDGSQAGCYWLTTAGGISYQPFQNTVSRTTAIDITGSNLVNALIQGQVFNVSVIGAVDTDTPNIVSTTFTAGPVGAMTDFSVSSLTDPDPAQSYTSWNNAGLTVPASGYARSSGTFFPPQDYFVSGNQQLYARGAFMAVGFQFSGVPNNQKVLVTDVQAEIQPYITAFGNVTPSNYVLPRQVQTIIKPNRLNYCTNPNMEISLANWTAVGTAVLSQDTTITGPNTSQLLDDVPQGNSAASMKIAVSHSGDGVSMQLTNLIAGDTYIMSAYVQAGANVTDISMSCANGTTSVISGNSGTGYGSGTFGGGPFGGRTASGAAIPTGQWFRIFTTFQPTDSTVTLVFSALILSTTNFWLDAVLVEPGQVLMPYFDGNFGHNYFWETGGAVGLSRSYYYDQFAVKAQAVNNILSHHTPYGISSATPLFAVPPTQ